MITINVEDIYPGLLIFLRATGLFLIIPVFSGTMIPATVRVAISAILAYLLAPIFGNFGGVPGHWFIVVMQVIHEILTGLLMGFAVRFLLYALEMAGEIIAVQIGLSLSSNIDPVTRNQATPPNTMLLSLGTILFLVTGAYQFCFVAFARSFELFPPSAIFEPQSINTVIAASGKIFLLAVQISAPLLAISFLVNMSFSVLGRAAPSLNVFMLSFPVQILAGLTVFSMTLGLTIQYILRDIQLLPESMLRFLR
jgi:flagellar biosynthetic protein FliR